MIINTDAEHERSAWVTIDASLHASPPALTCLSASDRAHVGLTTVVEARNGRAARITVPPGGFVGCG